MNPLSNDALEQTRNQSRYLAMRMRSGTGVNKILGGEDSATHYMDALERFKKDYAAYDRERREMEKRKRDQELEKKRIEHLERENKRWEVVEEHEHNKQQKLMHNIEEVQMGRKKTANSNGLAYNPINLVYDKNPQGEKLKTRDEDYKIRGYVRAYNMDHHGNGTYNPLNGEERVGVTKIVPNDLSDRYREKLNVFQEDRKLKVPQSSNDVRKNVFHYY